MMYDGAMCDMMRMLACSGCGICITDLGEDSAAEEVNYTPAIHESIYTAHVSCDRRALSTVLILSMA